MEYTIPIIELVLTGIGLWFVNTYKHVDGNNKKTLNVLVIIIVLQL